MQLWRSAEVALLEVKLEKLCIMRGEEAQAAIRSPANYVADFYIPPEDKKF